MEHTIEQLKAYAYDLIGRMQSIERELVEVNKVIEKKSNLMPTSETPLETKEEIKELKKTGETK